MIGSIDCMHWEWRNRPTGWAGQYTGHVHRPIVVLEAFAGYNTWIWHDYFGTVGSLNDINIICKYSFPRITSRLDNTITGLH
ncbi:hypothetical protein LINGRAHAP2_LOCUS4917 [Linum grandiflorum]